MWHPYSWQTFPLRQQAHYADAAALKSVTDEIAQLPPLVTEAEIESLQNHLADAAIGKRFLLQGGDCAESFADCRADIITSKLKILLKMSLILLHGMNKPVIRVGRIAGQYAKPRSEDHETRDGVTLPAYRGDLVNAVDFNAEARQPQPQRLRTGYTLASLTLNYLRALTESGFGDLSAAEHWDLAFVQRSPRAHDYRRIVEDMRRALRLMQALDVPHTRLERSEFFTCHEALHLHYEAALTRRASHGRWYNFSTHLPWVGMRTADLGGGHIEYLRGIANPVALKVGPGLTREQLLRLCERLNPGRLPGRLTLIHRYGRPRIEQCLPAHVEAVRQEGHPVLWCCDPMHGNTQTLASGVKTRHFDDILAELERAFDLHRTLGSILGGVHFELTGDAVTECIGGASGLSEKDLERAYHSLVDPRLNSEQALEMALLIAQNGNGSENADVTPLLKRPQ